jgi:hypothetical protein
MNNGINNINIFEKLLQRFKFNQILPDEVKKFITQYERTALTTTLKNFNEYNFVYGLVTRIFFLSYKFKLRLSIKQSKILLGFISILMAGVLTLSILFFAESIKNYEPKLSVIPANQLPHNYQAESSNSKPINNDNKGMKEPAVKDTGKNTKYRLGVNLFSAKNIEDDLSKLVTDTISKELSRTLGKNRIIDLNKSRKGINFNRILSGSVAGLGKKIIISVKVVDVEDSKVILGITETIDSASEIEVKCTDIAEMIKNGIKWE